MTEGKKPFKYLDMSIGILEGIKSAPLTGIIFNT